MAEHTDVLHSSILNENLLKNSARILKTKQVIDQYENQIKLFKQLPATLKKSVLIPIGSKGFLRGHIIHTNEVFHNVGCGYVIKRTSKQAIEFCDRMLNETNNFLTQLFAEEKWLQDQINVPAAENAFGGREQVEIMEKYDETAEREWRVKHRESLKKAKQDEAKNRINEKSKISDEELFARLDELEILEEIEGATELFKKEGNSVSNSEFEGFLNKKSAKNEELEQNSRNDYKLDEETIIIFNEKNDTNVNKVVENRNNDKENMKEQIVDNNIMGKIVDDIQKIDCLNIEENIDVKRKISETIDNSINKEQTIDIENKINSDDKPINKDVKSSNKNNLDIKKISIDTKVIDKNNALGKITDEITISVSDKEVTVDTDATINQNNKNEIDLKRKTGDTDMKKLEEELELTRKNKTIIKTEDDLMRRLDELEREENLLEEMELLSCSGTNCEMEITLNEIKNNEEYCSNEDISKNSSVLPFNEKVHSNFYDANESILNEKTSEEMVIKSNQIENAASSLVSILGNNKNEIDTTNESKIIDKDNTLDKITNDNELTIDIQTTTNQNSKNEVNLERKTEETEIGDIVSLEHGIHSIKSPRKRLNELKNEENDEYCSDDDNSKKTILRFNEKVRTNFYDSNEAVMIEEIFEQTVIKSKQIEDAASAAGVETEPHMDDNEAVTLDIYFSHTPIVDQAVEAESNDEPSPGLLKPSNLYDMPYRPKSILKNKNRIFDEPQHNQSEVYIESPPPVRNHRRKDRSKKVDRNWVCCDTFSLKNSNDSDQENANVAQVPPPLSEVKEKTLEDHTESASATMSSIQPVKKRQSRFSVSRALITKK